MPDPAILLAFVGAALVVLVIPGPGVVYVTTQAAACGARGGIVSAAGLSVGVLAHVAAASLGLSALLLVSAQAMTLVKLAGALYLIYLGWKMISSPPTTREAGYAAWQPHRVLFMNGVAVSILNPKIAVFFLAFLPQFINPAVAAPQFQILLLGGLYCVLAFITDSAYALLAHSLSRRMAKSVAAKLPFNKIGGWLLIGLGLKAALTDTRGPMAR